MKISIQKTLINTATLIIFLFTSAFEPSRNKSLTINLSVDVNANRKTISPYIYGLNFAKETFANEIDLPIRRWGGNATSRYNWQNGNLNSANDWYFENNTNTNAYNWSLAETHTQWINQNENTNTSSLITIPMLGYVAKNNTSCGYSILKYGAQQDHDTWRSDCGNGVATNGTNVTNDPLDTSVAVNPAFMQNWVTSMVTQHGASNNGGVQFYALDNEPELWSETHRDVHPTHQTYDELLAKSISYAEVIKSTDPNAKIFGYSSFGWSGYLYSWHDLITAANNGYTYFPDYATHGNMYQVEWYLSEMNQYEQDNNLRLLDYLDLHYYPNNGVALQNAGDTNLQALRLRSTRSLWDPTYRDESWIGGDDQLPDHRYIRLIPRMKNWVNTYYPNTKLAITEYNFGGLESMNGALAQADVLGIFGREGLDVANLWNYPMPNSPLEYDHFEDLPGAYAFRMFRNYDGNGNKFGDVSVQANSPDQSQLAMYASQRSSDNALTLMVINKTSSAIDSTISISNFTAGQIANVYEYSNANLTAIVKKNDISTTGSSLTTTFPANSITLIILLTPSTFLDVPSNAFGWAHIESIYQAGITGGCSTNPLNYCPNNTVTRAQMAVFLMRGIHGSSYSPPPATGTVFLDIPANSFAAAFIEAFSTQGITGGCGGGNYCPNGIVSRSQMAIFLLRAKHGSSYTPPAATGTMFADVPLGTFAPWIEQLANEGITGGCSAGNYCPNNSVTRAQMAIFIQRTFSLPLP